VNPQVHNAYEQVVESEWIVRLYEKTILPAARNNVDATRSAHEARQDPFRSLIEAPRNRAMLLESSYEALAHYFLRRPTLERVAGGPFALAPSNSYPGVVSASTP
jgi:hypothetical protein